MAKSRTTLKQRIALDSGDQIEAELMKIGKTGEAALKAIGDAAKAFAGPGKAISDLVKRAQAALQREYRELLYKRGGDDLARRTRA